MRTPAPGDGVAVAAGSAWAIHVMDAIAAKRRYRFGISWPYSRLPAFSRNMATELGAIEVELLDGASSWR